MHTERVPLQIPLDEKNYLDRQCPSKDCLSYFKVLIDDWKDKVSDAVVYCPICRHESEATQWNTPEQDKYIEGVVQSHAHKLANKVLKKMARDFNARQPKGGMISASMTIRPGPRPLVVLPKPEEALRQDFMCESCQCRYSSLGAAFFCPACGHNSANGTFVSAIRSVRACLANLDQIRSAFDAQGDKDAASDAERLILENSLTKLVASFQRFAEATFQLLPNASSFTVGKNQFQRLTGSSTLWRNATGKGYEDFLDLGEMAALIIFFQQRHLLSHTEGMVDQEYIDKSNDRSYTKGQKLVIKKQAVYQLADLLEKLSNNLRQLVP
jgi:hypothetical protein